MSVKVAGIMLIVAIVALVVASAFPYRKVGISGWRVVVIKVVTSAAVIATAVRYFLFSF